MWTKKIEMDQGVSSSVNKFIMIDNPELIKENASFNLWVGIEDSGVTLGGFKQKVTTYQWKNAQKGYYAYTWDCGIVVMSGGSECRLVCWYEA